MRVTRCRLRKRSAQSKWIGVACCLLFLEQESSASTLNLEFVPELQGQPATLGAEYKSPAGGETLRLQRLDWLLSKLVLQTEEGKWLESSDWFFYGSLGERRLTATSNGVGPGKYKAVRFTVGLPKEVNEADPNQWESGHDLHPSTNHLHWGWAGGYIFMAYEGHWLKSEAKTGSTGFSYHLATSPMATEVAIPVVFEGKTSQTLQIGLDIAKLIGGPKGWKLAESGTSTHSRENDTLAHRFAANIASAFTAKRVLPDIYQQRAVDEIKAAAQPPVGTRPYELKLSQRLPKTALPNDNPLTQEGVELGRRLFHETRLSINNQQSCASCHLQERGFTDAGPVSLGAQGQKGRRRAMPLMNLVWAKEFFWDGRVKTLRQQVLHPIQDKLEMAETLPNVVEKLKTDSSYAKAFARAFGSEGVSAERLGLALEQYLFTLVSQDSKFDQAARGLTTLSPAEKRGLQLFVTEFDPARGLKGADCFHCHGGNLFTTGQLFNNGLNATSDLGRYEFTKDPLDRQKFKAPSLRNVAARAPYMHDGRFNTLEEVINHYDHGISRSETLDPNIAKHPPEGLGLSAEDKSALVAFLHTLTDTAFLGEAAARLSPPQHE